MYKHENSVRPFYAKLNKKQIESYCGTDGLAKDHLRRGFTQTTWHTGAVRQLKRGLVKAAEEPIRKLSQVCSWFHLGLVGNIRLLV